MDDEVRGVIDMFEGGASGTKNVQIKYKKTCKEWKKYFFFQTG